MEKIEKALQEVERRYDVSILYACETGSRAWGFPSPDSDFDVRFVYLHKKDWYLALNNQKDTIEFMDGDLDVTGWDVRKCLKLLKKSNVPLIERFQSPVQYSEQAGFRAAFLELIQAYYSPTAAFYHHYSLAGKFWQELQHQEQVKLKSYCYLVRSLLSCNWIVRDKTVLPMHMDGLMQYIDEKSRRFLKDLIALKATVGESYLHPKDGQMVALVLLLLEYIESGKNDLGVNRQDYSLLNQFFLKLVQ